MARLWISRAGVNDLEPITESPRTQFSIRAMIALTAAIALWLWIFREATPFELGIFSGIAFVAGLVAHLFYTFWLPSRITAIATVLLIYNAILVVLALWGSNSNTPVADCLEFLIDILAQPVEMLMHLSTPRQTMFTLAIVLGTILPTPAHSIRPSLPSAFITALGIGIWYAAGMLFLIYAG